MAENKSKQEIEDIMSAITSVDENSSLNKLPHCCVESLDDVPIMRMEKGELAILISKQDKMDENFNSLHCYLNTRCNTQAIGQTGSNAMSKQAPVLKSAVHFRQQCILFNGQACING